MDDWISGEQPKLIWAGCRQMAHASTLMVASATVRYRHVPAPSDPLVSTLGAFNLCGTGPIRIFTCRHKWSALEKRILIGYRKAEQFGAFGGLVFDRCDLCIREKRQMAGYRMVAGALHF